MLTLWMFPSHKLFDHTLLLGGIWIAARLVEEPSHDRIFTAGVFLGLSVFFGRNHALYNFLAQACLLLLLYFKLHPLLSASYYIPWLAGIAIGLAPIIAMFVFVSGFAASYIESIRSIFRHGTNLALPIPWPWRPSQKSAIRVSQFLLGVFLIVLPLAYIAAITFSFSWPPDAISVHGASCRMCVYRGVLSAPRFFTRGFQPSRTSDSSFHVSCACVACFVNGWSVVSLDGGRNTYYRGAFRSQQTGTAISTTHLAQTLGAIRRWRKRFSCLKMQTRRSLACGSSPQTISGRTKAFSLRLSRQFFTQSLSVNHRYGISLVIFPQQRSGRRR